MFGLGTIVNCAAVVAGGILGHFTGRLFKEEQGESIKKACGVSVIFIAIAGAMQGMLHVDADTLISGKSMLVVLSIAIGTIIGELLRIERGIERFGEFLKRKTGNSSDNSFVNAFVTASFTVCIGAMAVVGAVQDGISGDYSTLFVKSILDFIIIAVMTSTMGKGCVFSAIPILIFEGTITIVAKLFAPALDRTATAYISLVGSILIFCVGVNLTGFGKIKVANMLPALLLAVVFAYIPYEF